MPKRTNLSRERAISVAVALADAEGISAVTMRSVANALGVEAMSLYHHVANKEDVLDGMVDLVMAEIELPSADEPWRDAMRRRAESARAALRRHPWAPALVDSRTNAGPATWRHHDAVIGCLRRAGFTVAQAGHAFSLLDSYVFGFALTEVNLPFESPEEAEALAQAMLERMPPEEYPHLVEFTTEHVLAPGYDHAEEFAWGLELVLEGLDRALRPGGGDGASPRRALRQ